MASDIDVVNLALGHLGDTARVANINPPEGSVQSFYAARYYKQARDEALSAHTWSFCTRRITPASVALPSYVNGWAYAYAMPSDWVKIVAVLYPGSAGVNDFPSQDSQPQEYTLEMLEDGDYVLYTNVQNCVLRYTHAVTDPTRWTPVFIRAMSYLLAHLMAGPLTKDTTKQQTMLQLYEMVIGRAKHEDQFSAEKNDQWKRENLDAPWIKARAFGAFDTYRLRTPDGQWATYPSGYGF